MPDDKFIQPADAIEVERKTGVGTLLSQDVLRDARRRIAAGEDREKVILELAFMQVELEEGMREDGLLPPEEEEIRTLFDPDQERDEQGRWTDTGGAGALDLGKSGWQRDKTAIVRRRAETIARELGVPPAIINVVDKEPRAFTVGNQQFREAGHYNPQTGMIEINARNSYDDRMSVTNGIAAHEVSHAIYDAARLAQTTEHHEILDLSEAESKRLFRASGYVRPEMQAEVHERWPVSAMFYKHIGDSYMETEEDQSTSTFSGAPAGKSRFQKISEQLAKDDGVSEYSKSYWQPEALKLSGGMDRAVNETLAETVRHQIVETSWHGDITPHESWRAFAEDLRKIAAHPKVKARLGRRQ